MHVFGCGVVQRKNERLIARLPPCTHPQISGASIKVSQKGEVVPGTTNRIVTITGSVVAANYAQMLVLQKVPDATSV